MWKGRSDLYIFVRPQKYLSSVRISMVFVEISRVATGRAPQQHIIRTCSCEYAQMNEETTNNNE